MFYTKYRPQKFSELIGQTEISSSLMKQVLDSKVSHAYLLIGPRGIGKTTTARLIAKAVNCTALGENGDPCGICDNCVSISKGSFLDLIEIDAASNRGIDDIRSLKDKIKLTPSFGKKKVYIIDEVHMLTAEAFNALLKTLEEPPAHSIFILCTTEGNKVPDTIKSRCQTFKFSRAKSKDISTKLKKISSEENFVLKETDIDRIARSAKGGFRDAETLLQQIIEGGGDADSYFNTVENTSDYLDFVNLLSKPSPKDALLHLKNVFDHGVDLYVWTGGFLRVLRELLLCQNGLLPEESYTDEEKTAFKETSLLFDSSVLSKIIDTFMKAHNEIKNSFIEQLPLELAVVSLFDNNETNTETEKPKPVKNDSPKLPEKKEKTEEFEKKSTEDKSASKGSFDSINNQWVSLLKHMSKENTSLMALLKSCTLLDFKDSTLKVKVPFDFHKERLSSANNSKILDKAFNEVFGYSFLVDISVEKPVKKSLDTHESGMLTDLNITVPSSSDLVGILDGALPM